MGCNPETATVCTSTHDSNGDSSDKGDKEVDRSMTLSDRAPTIQRVSTEQDQHIKLINY